MDYGLNSKVQVKYYLNGELTFQLNPDAIIVLGGNPARKELCNKDIESFKLIFKDKRLGSKRFQIRKTAHRDFSICIPSL